MSSVDATIAAAMRSARLAIATLAEQLARSRREELELQASVEHLEHHVAELARTLESKRLLAKAARQMLHQAHHEGPMEACRVGPCERLTAIVGDAS